MRAAALRYRVMAYITGVLIIVVCFVGIPLQVAAHSPALEELDAPRLDRDRAADDVDLDAPRPVADGIHRLLLDPTLQRGVGREPLRRRQPGYGRAVRSGNRRLDDMLHQHL